MSYKRLFDYVNEYLLYLMAFVMPLFVYRTNALVVGFAGMWIVGLFFKKKVKNTINIYSVLPILFIIFYALSALYSSNKMAVLIDLQAKLAILIVPLAFTNIRINRKVFNRILIIFLIGLFLSCIILLVDAWLNSFYTLDGIEYFNISKYKGWRDKSIIEQLLLRDHHFSSGDLTEAIYYFHPSYFAMFLIFGTVATVYLIRNNWKRSYMILPIGILLIIFDSCMVFLCDSRAGFLTFLVVVTMLIFRFMFLKSNLLFKIVSVILVLGIFVGSVKFLRNDSKVEIVKKYVSNDSRTQFWIASFKALEKSPILGIGGGDVEEAIFQYFSEDLKKEYDNNPINPHNNFLFVLVGMGIFGLILFSFIFLLPLIVAIKQSNWLVISFCVIMIISLFFESMLNRYIGVVFFAFFYNVLISTLRTNKKMYIFGFTINY